jgi:hypothetical protein
MLLSRSHNAADLAVKTKQHRMQIAWIKDVSGGNIGGVLSERDRTS